MYFESACWNDIARKLQRQGDKLSLRNGEMRVNIGSQQQLGLSLTIPFLRDVSLPITAAHLYESAKSSPRTGLSLQTKIRYHAQPTTESSCLTCLLLLMQYKMCPR
jgi:hypothetical protein